MRKIFILFIILLSFYTSYAQSSRNVNDNQQLRGSQISGATDFIENLTVYPNPVIDILKVSFKTGRKGIAVVSLYNNIGKQIFSQESLIEQGNNLITIDVRSKAIEPGIYFLQCVVEKEIVTRKLIVK